MRPKKKPLFGILGGMGPHASAYFHGLLLELVSKNGSAQGDASFPDIIHFSMPSRIPDRTSFLNGEEMRNPADACAHIVKLMEAIANAEEQEMLLAIPCNTFFSIPIYTHFQTLLEDRKIKGIHPIPIVLPTLQKIMTHCKPAPGSVAVLSTSGEREFPIYKDKLEKNNFRVLQTEPLQQKILHEIIYNIKKNGFASNAEIKKLEALINNFKKQGAQTIILACTELSIISKILRRSYDDLIDPLEELGEFLIRLYKEA